MAGRVTVVGLGPAGPELVSVPARDAIERIPRRYLRTERHPAASVVGPCRTFDAVYEEAATFEDVYERIAAELVTAAAEGDEVLYAVPGSPWVLERSVELLATAAAEGRVELSVVAAMSFVDLAWGALGVDPFDAGVRLVDGHRFAEGAAGERGPLLVAECHSRRVLSDVKLAVDEPPERPVTVLQRLGLADESVFDVDWVDLDRGFEPDHLTSLWVPELDAPVAFELQRFVELVATLRQRCPWDREQTHRSLTRHLLEESYEVLEALEAVSAGANDADPHLAEELGDLLFQIVFHATLAAERGAFTMADVARVIHDKLVHRHPHVFGGVDAPDVETVLTNWEQLKKVEKNRSSVMDGLPANLPSLLYAHKVGRKAESVGRVGATDPEAVVARVEAALAEPDDERIGEALLALVDLSRRHGVDPESALRAAAGRVREEVRAAGQ